MPAFTHLVKIVQSRFSEGQSLYSQDQPNHKKRSALLRCD